jgi:hypothetical protein
MDGGLLGFLWYVVMVFAFVAYLFILFYIFTDLFRDHQLSGWWKALWIVALIFLFPPFPALAYLIFRGRGMAERTQKAASAAVAAQQEYIKQVAGTSTPTDQITAAQSLLDAGAITQDEFNQLKAKALSS